MASITIKIRNKTLAQNLQNILNKTSSFLKGEIFKKLVVGVFSIILLGAALDFGTYWYFKTQVLAYAQNGIIVTKGEVTKRLLEIPPYTQITLQQLINDVAINQLVTIDAKKRRITVTTDEIKKRLQENGQDIKDIDAKTLESLKVVMLMEKLANVKEPTITDKQAKEFFERNKKIYNFKKFDDKTKKQIKAYLRDQQVEAQIVKWLDTRIKEIGFVSLIPNNQLKYKPLTGLRLMKICFKHLFTK